jgi:uncharacterized circularly permuted ATP-grasp superfamily protein/uncharacterized alpha-E superfamily protein
MITSSPSQSRLGAVLDGYAGRGGAFDEMIDAVGNLRPHWRTFAEGLDHIGSDEFLERWLEARELIRENGVTYNVYGDPRGLDRPWQLDPVPLLIAPHESEQLEAGLLQRGRLLEAILADVYGPQQILLRGLLPPELVFANPGFLRPCHGVRMPGDRYLHLIGADIGRGSDGNFRIISDRTQAPSGAGYALENRIVLGRMLPEVFKACQVQRLALFFRNLRDTLRSLAPHNREQPRAVLLTPGPYNETYFEHAYLARYLGFILAEGADLTVRDQRVYLKFLDGLQPVDIILRRLDDDFCDPLELRGDSFLGIPGLVQVVRAGNVVVANALGSGFAEAPALQPFLPTLCRHLLGEELLLPGIEAYWCGEGTLLDHVLTNLDDMVIKASFPSMRLKPIFPRELDAVGRQEVVDRLRARPWAYVGQRRLDLSTTPVLTDAGFVPRNVVFRTYLAAHDGSFCMMPGGLTRVTGGDETMITSLQHGGGSKDTWMLTEGDVSEFSMLRGAGTSSAISRGGNDLPSRAADNLFWLGRYVQRAEDQVRLLRGILVRLTEKAGLAEVPELPLLLRALTQLMQAYPGFVGEGADARLASPENELASLVHDPQRIGSLAYNVLSIHRAAFSVRDRISMDMWRILGNLSERSVRPEDPGNLGAVLDLLNDRVITLAAFGGIATESMTRGHGWRFLEMGRKLERSTHTVGLLRATLTHAGPWESSLLEALLEIADSSMTYRRRYVTGIQPGPVLDLLLADESNPRSLVSQLIALRDVIDQLPHEDVTSGRSPEQRLALKLVTAVQLVDVAELAGQDTHGRRAWLEAFLKKVHDGLPQLSDAISHHYLSHLQVSRQLAGGG